MMTKNMGKKLLLPFILLMILISSCGSPKNYSYLQDMVSGRGYIPAYKPKTVIRKNDRVNIVVSSKVPELALPFNQNAQSIQVTNDGQVRTAAAAQPTRTSKGYLVDDNGNIDFPILGLIQVEGLSLKELEELVKSKLETGNYIKDPIVTTEFLNFKFYVLGAISGKGEHSVDRSQINLLEAIAIAGDLTPNGRPDRVAVIRDNDGSQIVYMLDLRSKDIFDSPAFYLKQNDIIYVESHPESKRNTIRENISFFTSLLSVVTTVVSVVLITRNLKK